ncbi:MAG: MFS transporter [Acidobacteria bacterium]|nr:MFS transporter [Acidobacteriota bacterium]
MSSPFRALRSRNYRLFFIGQGISLIGSWMTRLATAWLVYRLTDSAFLLGFVSFAGQAPSLFLPPLAGVWLDRFDRHKVLVATQAAAMAQSLALAALTLSGYINMPWIVGLTLFQGVVNAIEIPTRQAFVVRMIDDRADLSNAIALNSSNFNATRLVGPAIAGAVVAAVGEGYCFLIDGLSYIAVIWGLLSMRLTPEVRPPATRRLGVELGEGWRYVTQSTPIRSLLLFLGAIGILSAPYSSLMPIVAGRTLAGGAHTLGFLMAASGIGALVCAVQLVLRTTIVGLGRTITVSVAAFGTGIALLGLSHWLWLSMALMAVTGYGLMHQVVATNTIVQTIVDDDKRGRVMSFYTIALLGSAPIGSLIGGLLAARIGVEATFGVTGIGCVLTALWFWRQLPAIRAAIRPRYVELGIISDT